MNEFLVKLIANGGPGSGNFNPGQGRGVGKPSEGSSSLSSKKELTKKQNDTVNKCIKDDKFKNKLKSLMRHSFEEKTGSHWTTLELSDFVNQEGRDGEPTLFVDGSIKDGDGNYLDRIFIESSWTDDNEKEGIATGGLISTDNNGNIGSFSYDENGKFSITYFSDGERELFNS